MALITCPECKKQVSDTAKSCPSCGYAIAAQTVEATGKRYKTVQFMGGLLAALGFSVMFVPSLNEAGVVFAGLGSLIYIFGRICAWWYHG